MRSKKTEDEMEIKVSLLVFFCIGSLQFLLMHNFKSICTILHLKWHLVFASFNTRIL